MFQIENKKNFVVLWDYDLSANPACVSYTLRLKNPAGVVVAINPGIDRAIRKKLQVCNVLGTHTIMLCAVDSKGVEGDMAEVKLESVAAQAVTPPPPVTPPNPGTKLPAPTNLRLEPVQ